MKTSVIRTTSGMWQQQAQSLTFIQIAKWLPECPLTSIQTLDQKQHCWQWHKYNINCCAVPIGTPLFLSVYSSYSSRWPTAYNYHRDCPSAPPGSQESKLYCSIDQAQATLLQPSMNTGPKPGIDKAAGSNASPLYASTHTSKSCKNDTVKPPTVAPLQFQTVAVRFALFANLALPTKLRLCYWKLLAA